MPFRNRRTEMFCDEVRGILGSRHLCQLQVVAFEVILQPQVANIEMTELAEPRSPHYPYGRTRIGVDSGVRLCSQVQEHRHDAQGLCSAFSQSI